MEINMKTTTNPSTTDWEKEFDEHFDEVFEMTRNRDFKDCSASVKFFIRTLLSRKEEEVRKEVVESIARTTKLIAERRLNRADPQIWEESVTLEDLLRIVEAQRTRI